MVAATFRFFAQLNSFLAPACRGRAFSYPCARAATVKHMIEALGPPHTEVQLVRANDNAVGFDYIIRDGDRITVYPWFRTLNVSGLPNVPQLAPMRLRFIADSHLGGLAHLLRLAGFDTLYDNNYDDACLEAIASREDRIVLSRDVELLKRRSVRYGCYVYEIKPELQFREIAQRYALASKARPFYLCLSCNAPLQPISKLAALPRLPPRVQQLHDRFSTCHVCHRVFWEGSHWRRMQAVLNELLPTTTPRSENR